MPTAIRPRSSPVTSPTLRRTSPAAASAVRACSSAAFPATVSVTVRAERSKSRAHPGLADVHPLGGTCEVPLLGDRDEVLQLTQFHDH
jgi:hypothetical protein